MSMAIIPAYGIDMMIESARETRPGEKAPRQIHPRAPVRADPASSDRPAQPCLTFSGGSRVPSRIAAASEAGADARDGVGDSLDHCTERRRASPMRASEQILRGGATGRWCRCCLFSGRVRTAATPRAGRQTPAPDARSSWRPSNFRVGPITPVTTGWTKRPIAICQPGTRADVRCHPPHLEREHLPWRGTQQSAHRRLPRSARSNLFVRSTDCRGRKSRWVASWPERSAFRPPSDHLIAAANAQQSGNQGAMDPRRGPW